MTSILQLVLGQTLTGVFLVYTTLMLLHLAIQVTFAELNRRRGLRASYLRPPRATTVNRRRRPRLPRGPGRPRGMLRRHRRPGLRRRRVGLPRR